MNTIFKVMMLLPLLCLPVSGMAKSEGQRLSYTYAEGRLVVVDPDGGGNYDGITVGGSLQFRPQLFGVAALTSVGDRGFDLTTFDVGVGYRYSLQRNVDLVGIGGLAFAESDFGPFEDDDVGLSLTGGARAFLTPQIEVGGYANYRDLFDDGDITLTGEGLLHMTPDLAFVASLGLSDDANTITFGARWNFR